MSTELRKRYRCVTVKLPIRETLRRFISRRVWVRKVTRFEEVLPGDPRYKNADFEEMFFKTVGYQGDFQWLNMGDSKKP